MLKNKNLRLISVLPAISFITGLCGFAQNAPSKWTVELMTEVTNFEIVQASPDGKKLAYVPTVPKKGYVPQIYLADVKSGSVSQLTFGNASSTDPFWSPDGKWIAFLSDRSGKRNVWVIGANGGEARQITDVATSVTSYRWSRDGKMIAFTVTELEGGEDTDEITVVDRDISKQTLWATSVEGGSEARRIVSGDLTVIVNWDGNYDWSIDGKTIVFSHAPISTTELFPKTDISVVDMAGNIRPLRHTNAAEIRPFFSPDGRWVAYSSNEGTFSSSSDLNVYIIPTQGGQPRKLAAPFNQEPFLLGWSADSKRVIVDDRDRTLRKPYALPIDGGSAEPLLRNFDAWMPITTVNATNTSIAFIGETPNHPPELYVSGIDQVAPVKVTSLNSKLSGRSVGRTEVVEWKSGEGLMIEGLLTYPMGYEKGKKYPLLVIAHGGPAGHFVRHFIGKFTPSQGPYPIAVFAEEGYAVLRPNVRGSTGYGKNFRHANYGEMGRKDFQDLMAGVDYLIDHGIADPERLGIMGWSYGGFMAATAVTQTTRFKAASVGACFSNLFSYFGIAHNPMWFLYQFGSPWEQMQNYEKRSPVFNVKGATTPTLIQHGAYDGTAPISQARELYRALKTHNVATRMEVYRNFGHDLEPSHIVLQCAKRNIEWFKQYLPTSGRPAAAIK